MGCKSRLQVRLLAMGLACLCACRQDMHDAPRYEPFEGTDFFGDGRTMRPLVEGTVARGRLAADLQLETGKIDGQFAATFPFAMDRAALQRGRERYGIFCAPCHGATGAGDGIIVERGLKKPESFHIERLRTSPPGYYFDVMTNGFGAMYDYADRIPAADRWRIAAWIRVLHESQNASLQDLDDSVRARLLEQSVPGVPAPEPRGAMR